MQVRAEGAETMRVVAGLVGAIALVLSSGASALVTPVGLWDFDDAGDLTAAQVGADLTLIGSHEPVEGTGSGDGAARIGAGSYYACDHGISANGGGALVNEYTIVLDVRVFGRGLWHCLVQTNEGNANDGDVFISKPGRVGVSATGYSFPRMLDAKTWYRVAIVVDNGERYEIYADGIRILEGAPQSVDGRFSLDPAVLFFADDNGEDAEVDVSRIALYDSALSASEVESLAGLGGLDHYATRPFLQNVRQDGISIMWETETLETAHVEYGLDSGYGMVGPATAVDSGSQTRIYTAVLSGLSPATTYHYRAVTGGVATGDRTFTTAPAGSADFSFGVWSDSQGYNGGDYDRDPTEPTRAILRHVIDEGMDFGVNCGDLAESGGDYTDTRVFYVDRAVAAFGEGDRPFFSAWGNHDGSSGTIIRKYADLPSKDRGPPFHAGYGSYSFDYAGCHFICIDYLREHDDIPGWVEQDLQSSAAENAKFTFVFVHRPPYCERWIDGQANLREDLVPLMEEYGVDVCFSGHTHAYGRGELNGVYYCVTGGGSWLDHDEPLVHDWPHMTVGGYHDVAPDIDGGLVHEYVRVDITGGVFTARMMAFNPDGTFREVLDTFWKEIEPAGVPDLPVSEPGFGASNGRPNPFTGWTTITFAFGGGNAGGAVALRVYDLRGRLVRALSGVASGSGTHEVRWDGRDDRGVAVGCGLYFYALDAGPHRTSGKLVVVR